MVNEKTVRGTNFTCVPAGPKEGWTEFRLEPPDVPRPAKGKMFLRNLLGSAGMEMSLNVVQPGKGSLFLPGERRSLRHRRRPGPVSRGRRVHRRGGRLDPSHHPGSVTSLAEQFGCASVLPLHPVSGRQRDPGRHPRRTRGRR